MEWLSLQAFVLVRLINFHKKMSIQPLGWGAVKTYGFALNWKNRIAALQVLVREYNLQLTAIQHLSETQLGETIFVNDWRTCSLSIHSATLKSTPSKPDKHKFWKTTLVLMGILLLTCRVAFCHKLMLSEDTRNRPLKPTGLLWGHVNDSSLPYTVSFLFMRVHRKIFSLMSVPDMDVFSFATGLYISTYIGTNSGAQDLTVGSAWAETQMPPQAVHWISVCTWVPLATAALSTEAKVLEWREENINTWREKHQLKPSPQGFLSSYYASASELFASQYKAKVLIPFWKAYRNSQHIFLRPNFMSGFNLSEYLIYPWYWVRRGRARNVFK